MDEHPEGITIPQTLDELRANVAACAPDAKFYPINPCQCLVTRPLNGEIDVTESYVGLGLCEFYPTIGRLYNAYSDGSTSFLPPLISWAASAFDRAYEGFPSITRDDALEWLDSYIAGVDA